MEHKSILLIVFACASGLLLPAVVANPLPGGGQVDSWVDANGDTMFGTLQMGPNAILLGNGATITGQGTTIVFAGEASMPNGAKLNGVEVTTSQGILTVGGVPICRVQDGCVLTTGSVQNDHLGNGIVTNAKLGAGAVTGDKIGPLTITATNIADLTITAPKLAAGSVTTAKIAAAAVTSTELALGSVTNGHLVDGAVDGLKVADLSLTDADISGTAAIAWGKVSMTGSDLGDLATRDAGDLSSGVLADARLASNVARIDQAKAWTSVQTFGANAALDGGTITTGVVSAGRLPTAGSGAAGILPTTGLTNAMVATTAAITYSKLAFSNNIVASDIATGGVATAEILDGTVTNADLAGSAAIADTKLATIATPGKVSDSALSGNVARLGSQNIWSAIQNFGNGIMLSAMPGLPPPSKGMVVFDSLIHRLKVGLLDCETCPTYFGTVAALETPQTWTKPQTFTAGNFALQNRIIDFPVPAGALSRFLPLPAVEPDEFYGVSCMPSWPTTIYVKTKSTTEVEVGFGTAAPPGGGETRTVDCFLFR